MAQNSPKKVVEDSPRELIAWDPSEKPGGGPFWTRGEWWMLKDQYEEGETITALAKETGHDRKTVRKYIHAGDKTTYNPRESKPGLLDLFQDFILTLPLVEGQN